MKRKFFAFAILVFWYTSVQANVFFDQNATNNVIFGGGGIPNGNFTVERSNGIELGLRARLRFDAANQSQNIFNSNGDGTYSFAAEIAPGGFPFAPNSPTTPIWNFEWSVNVDFDNSSGFKLDDLIYVLGIDFDPGVGTNFQEFDLINLASADHSIGTNATNAGAGSIANDAASYVALLSANNLAQNSWNMEFFNNAPFDNFDPTVDGNYTIFISASSNRSGELARVEANIIVGNGAAVITTPMAVPIFGGFGLSTMLLGILLIVFKAFKRNIHKNPPVVQNFLT